MVKESMDFPELWTVDRGLLSVDRGLLSVGPWTVVCGPWTVDSQRSLLVSYSQFKKCKCGVEQLLNN
jgi:hypothetical protein